MGNVAHVDPLVLHYKAYKLSDAITDIGKSWDHVSKDVIHKCFEELLPPEKFMEEYNAKHGTNQLWPANIFRGFDAGPKGDNEWERREAEKEEDRKHKVNFLHEILSKQTVYTFDKETIRQDLEYDPNRDTSVEALIMDGFHQMRLEQYPDLVRGEHEEDDDAHDAKELQLKALQDSHLHLLNMKVFGCTQYMSLADQHQYRDYIENAQHLITSYIRKAKQTDTDTASVPSTSGLTASAPSTSMLQTSTPSHSDDDSIPSEHNTLDEMEIIGNDILHDDLQAPEDDGGDLPNLNDHNDDNMNSAEILDYEPDADDDNYTTFRPVRTTAVRRDLRESHSDISESPSEYNSKSRSSSDDEY